MHKIPDLSDLPNTPAIYALYGGKNNRKFVAYVGIADKLRNRISQHLIRRDSSIVTGTSIVTLNPDYVTHIKWWESAEFSKRDYLEAAEIIAFQFLNPILRSRGKLTERSLGLLKDADYKGKITNLLQNKPSGSMDFPDFQELLERVNELENEIRIIKEKIKK